VLVILDVNIFLDYLHSTGDFFDDAASLLGLFYLRKATPLISSSSVSPLYFVTLRYFRSEALCRKALAAILETVTIVETDYAICIAALSSDMKEYEDGLVEAAGIKAGAKYLISRDENMLNADTSIEVITPKKFLKLIPSS